MCRTRTASLAGVMYILLKRRSYWEIFSLKMVFSAGVPRTRRRSRLWSNRHSRLLVVHLEHGSLASHFAFLALHSLQARVTLFRAGRRSALEVGTACMTGDWDEDEIRSCGHGRRGRCRSWPRAEERSLRTDDRCMEAFSRPALRDMVHLRQLYTP